MKSPMIDEYKCGCVITGDKLGIITWDKCAIHSKAPAMYEALKAIEGKLRQRLDHLGSLPYTNDREIAEVEGLLESLVASALEGL